MKNLSRILLVEDLQNWQDMIARLLGSDTHDVVVVDSLIDAKKKLMKQSFDVAIVDIRLDEGDVTNADGIAVLDELEKYYFEDRTHVVMLSGHANEKHAINALTRPNNMVLNFFLKQDLILESEEKRFLLDVERGVRATEIERSARAGRLFRRELSSVFLDVINFSSFFRLASSDHNIPSLLKDIRQLLNKLLFSKSPLTKNVKTELVTSSGEEFINILCWSRKSICPLGVTIAKRNNDTLRRQASSYWSQYGAGEVLAQNTTDFFAGVVFRLHKFSFEQFVISASANENEV